MNIFLEVITFFLHAPQFFSFLETKQKRTKGDRDEISPLIPQVKLPPPGCAGNVEAKPLNSSF